MGKKIKNSPLLGRAAFPEDPGSVSFTLWLLTVIAISSSKCSVSSFDLHGFMHAHCAHKPTQAHTPIHKNVK